MSTKSYNSKNVDIAINGIRLSGYADGELVNVTTVSDDVTTSVGSDGDMEISTTNDKRNTVTLNLQQTSGGNTTLSTIAQVPGTVFAFTLVDRTDGLTKLAGQGVITKQPDIVRARETGPVAWTLVVNATTRFVGGTPPVIVV